MKDGYKVDGASLEKRKTLLRSLGLASTSTSAAHTLFISFTVLGLCPGLHSFLAPDLFFKQQESGLPGSKQGDSHQSPPCQTTSSVLVEHSVNTSPFAVRKAAILRLPRLKTLSIYSVSTVRAMMRSRHIASAKVPRHPPPTHHRQRTRMPTAFFWN